MNRLTETDRVKAVVRAAAQEINNQLCIMLSMLWIVRYAPEVTDEHLATFRGAAERVKDQAAGLLSMASKHSAPPAKTETE